MNNLANAIIDVVAAPAVIVADMNQPAGILESSTPARPIGTANYRLPPQSPLNSWLDLTALNKVIVGGQEQSLSASNGNTAGSLIPGSLRDELPSRTGKIDNHRAISAINGRQAQFAALQTVVQNSRWTDADAEANFDIAQYIRTGKKHIKQLEQAIDEVWAEEDDIPVEL